MKKKSIENTYELFNGVAKNIRHDIIKTSRYATKAEISVKKRSVERGIKTS